MEWERAVKWRDTRELIQQLFIRLLFLLWITGTGLVATERPFMN